MTALALGTVCVALPAVLVVLIVLAYQRTQRLNAQRLADLASYAAHREWRFTADGTGLESRFEGDPFGRGSGRRATNVVEGQYDGRAFLAFDYAYTTGSGDDRTHHRCSVMTMHLGCTTPMLQVSPQGSVGRFFSKLFGTDLVIGQPGFDDAYHVRTDTPQFALDVLHPAMTALLASYQDRGWRFQGDSMLMFRAGQHTPQEIDAVLASMKAIIDQVPPTVWARLRGDG